MGLVETVAMCNVLLRTRPKFGCTSIYKAKIAERPISQTLCRGAYGSKNVRRIILNEQQQIKELVTLLRIHTSRCLSYTL